MRAKRSAAALAVVSILASGSPARARTAAVGLPFTLDAGGLPLVPVLLGELGSKPCVLDTGASLTVLSEQVARQLRLEPTGLTPVVSSAGLSTHELVKLPRLSLHGVTRSAVLAIVIPDARLRAISSGAACVVGQDVLWARDYTIDYERRLFFWDDWSDGPETRARASGATDVTPDFVIERLPLKSRAGRFVVELAQSCDPADSVWMVPDSGASDIVLFRQPDGPALPLIPPFKRAVGTLRAATGRRSVSAMRLERLRIGSRIELTDRPVYVVDRPEPGTREPGTRNPGTRNPGTRNPGTRNPEPRNPDRAAQGLLPLRLFARVSFRAADRMMIVAIRTDTSRRSRAPAR